MKAHQIRRLPVVGSAGTLLGLISMDDLVRAAGPRRVITNEQVIETLKAIYSDHHAAHVGAV
jgi:CBS domain-containing protein